jgi:hypothetical protein
LEFIVILKIQPFVIFFVFLTALGFSQAWQNDYKDQLPFIPQSPATSGKIITGMIASESANSR